MTAEISHLPTSAATAAEPEQLTDVQHTLRRAIAAKAHEARLVAGISERLARLEQIMAEDRQLEAQIRELQLIHQADRAVWLENGSDGPEPRVSKELAEARFSHAQRQADVAAALQRTPVVQGEQREAIERLSAASRELDLAVYAAAVECCRPIVARAATAFRQGLSELAKVISLADALRRGDDNASYAAAPAIDRLVAEARAAGVPPRPEVGPQLLQTLRVNPMAALS